MIRSFLLLILFWGVQFFVSLFFTLIFQFNNIMEGDHNSFLKMDFSPTMLGLVSIVFPVIMIGIMYCAHWIKYPRLVERPFLYEVKNTGFFYKWILPILIMIPTIYMASVLVDFFELPDLMKDQFVGMVKNIYSILGIVFLGPLVEEFVFRQVMIERLLKERKSPLFAIVFSSILFALAHLNPAQMLAAFLLGCLLGWFYWRTRDIRLSIIAHMFNNAVGVLTMIVSSENATLENFSYKEHYFATSAGLVIAFLLFGMLVKLWLKKTSKFNY